MCRDELNEEFYEKLQKILDKVNKNDYIMLIGDMNARVGNNRVATHSGYKWTYYCNTYSSVSTWSVTA